MKQTYILFRIQYHGAWNTPKVNLVLPPQSAGSYLAIPLQILDLTVYYKMLDTTPLTLGAEKTENT